MTIQWFPGHMQETELFLKQAVSNVDVVMEILDARLPASSSNPLLEQICKSILRIKILNKKDLADPIITRLWLDYFQSTNATDEQSTAVAITGTDSVDTWRALEVALSTLEASKKVKSKSRRLRVMVAGIPNTGKSTIMNTLAGKQIAKTGNVPAITRHQQRTGLKNKVDIYDTPGILWPLLQNQNGAYRLAASGAISDVAIDYNEIAIFILSYLIEKYPDALKERYDLSNIYDINNKNIRENQITNAEEAESSFLNHKTAVDYITMILEKIGAARGCLKKGGVVNLQKASELLIRELRSGKIGRISLESPEDFL
ncbi:MAG: ribosome biogenesis GTPase YlqF [Desulfamplus sp.]|nr:ribosome biogenesis GTPase YlqF [Desulfamplus sp.]